MFFFICSTFLFLVVLCEHLQCVGCKIEEVVSFAGFFFYLQHVSFFGCVVSICSVFVVKLRKLFP